MDVYLVHLGCRLNESEIEELAAQFAADGHRVVQEAEQADLCIVNSCTVTGEAGRKSRQVVRQLARRNPEARIAVTGCHATMAPREVARLPNVKWVVHNSDKERLVELVAPRAENGVGASALPRLGPGRLGRTRAFVKVQDGCDNRCTFCITTVARGEGRSRPLAQVVGEVQQLVAEAGYREVVLTGVHLGSYGHDLGNQDGLTDLIKALLARTDVPRLRLSSLEPWDLSADFFDLWADRRLCRQLHLPLQSGSDTVLRRMARRTNTEAFAGLVAAARDRIPDLALTTDVIVGFPGEGEQEFDESYGFVREMSFARLHVFPYSPRPGTAAARLSDPVPQAVKAERSRAMRYLGACQARRFHRRFLGRTMPVLWESDQGSGMWRGHTDNYLNVTTVSRESLANRITATRLVEAQGGRLRGELLDG